MRGKEENNDQKIELLLDGKRYNNLLDLCDRYRTQHGTDLTPKEYILMLIDSAISSVEGLGGE